MTILCYKFHAKTPGMFSWRISRTIQNSTLDLAHESQNQFNSFDTITMSYVWDWTTDCSECIYVNVASYLILTLTAFQ